MSSQSRKQFLGLTPRQLLAEFRARLRRPDLVRLHALIRADAAVLARVLERT